MSTLIKPSIFLIIPCSKFFCLSRIVQSLTCGWKQWLWKNMFLATCSSKIISLLTVFPSNGTLWLVTVSPTPTGCVTPGIAIIVQEDAHVIPPSLVGGGEHTGLGLLTVGPGTCETVPVPPGICGAPGHPPIVFCCTLCVLSPLVAKGEVTVIRVWFCLAFSYKSLKVFIRVRNLK